MPPSGRRRLPPEERREQLLAAAVELAAGGDVAAVSVQDLAARAGVSEGLLYHYFPTKQALVEAAVRRAADALLADLAAAAAVEGPFEVRIRAGLDAYLDHVQAQPTSWRALLAARTGPLAAVGEELEATGRQVVVAALGLAAPSPALLVALTGWSALEREACLAWLDAGAPDRTAVEDLLVGTFTAALAAVAPHDPELAAALGRS